MNVVSANMYVNVNKPPANSFSHITVSMLTLGYSSKHDFLYRVAC